MAAMFVVENVIERPALDPAGNVSNRTIIHLRTGRGAHGSLELSTDDYGALTTSADGKAALKAMLQEKADSLDAPFDM